MRFALALSVLCLASTAHADAISETRSLLPPIQIDALIVTPIIAADGSIGVQQDLVLDEAFAKNLVRIEEHDSMDQNHLTLTNKSDMFGSNALFAKLESKLLKSYVTEAVDVKATAANTAPTAKSVKTFIADSTKAKVETAHETAAATTSMQRGASSASSSVDNEVGNLYRNYNSM